MISYILRLRDQTLLITLIGLTLAVSGYGLHRHQQLKTQIVENAAAYASSTEGIKNKNRQLKNQLSGMQDKVTSLNEALEEAKEELEDQREKNEELEEKVEEVTESVGTLEKTVSTEPELLKKYSRTYFLNENYQPPELKKIDDEYTHENESLSVDERVWSYLKNLLEKAHDDGIDLLVTSAYRPFSEQAQLNNQYTRIYGTGANQFSAEQGYSEHQLGTTVDFTTPDINGLSVSFSKTEAFEWLEDNAHEYGFILSYPKGNQFYQYEPWHWRFVGEDLAEDLERKGDHFYDWSQREIDQYRSEIFSG